MAGGFKLALEVEREVRLAAEAVALRARHNNTILVLRLSMQRTPHVRPLHLPDRGTHAVQLPAGICILAPTVLDADAVFQMVRAEANQWRKAEDVRVSHEHMRALHAQHARTACSAFATSLTLASYPRLLWQVDHWAVERRLAAREDPAAIASLAASIRCFVLPFIPGTQRWAMDDDAHLFIGDDLVRMDPSTQGVARDGYYWSRGALDESFSDVDMVHIPVALQDGKLHAALPTPTSCSLHPSFSSSQPAPSALTQLRRREDPTSTCSSVPNPSPPSTAPLSVASWSLAASSSAGHAPQASALSSAPTGQCMPTAAICACPVKPTPGPRHNARVACTHMALLACVCSHTHDHTHLPHRAAGHHTVVLVSFANRKFGGCMDKLRSRYALDRPGLGKLLDIEAEHMRSVEPAPVCVASRPDLCASAIADTFSDLTSDLLTRDSFVSMHA